MQSIASVFGNGAFLNILLVLLRLYVYNVPKGVVLYMKRVLSIVICAVIIISTVVLPTLAKEEKTAFVVVSGMNTFPLTLEDEQVFPPSTNAILKLVSKVILPTGKFVIDRDYEALGDAIIPAVKEMFAPVACDEKGDSINNVNTMLFDCSLTDKTEFFADAESDEQGVIRAGIEKYGVENTFFFNYDWRLDPLVHADRLNDFIKTVRSTTECDRLVLAAFSMGGTVTLSYLYKYGSSDVDSVALCSTAFQGTSCVGEMFSGKVKLSMDGLMKRLAQLTRSNTYENLIEYLNEALNLSGINSSLSGIANTVSDNLNYRIYPELITPVFGYMPGFWAIVDGANYESAKAYTLKDANPDFIKRIDGYHYNVQAKAKEILDEAKKDTNVYIIAQYNMQGLPITETSTKGNNDYLIDTCLASGGAVCADLGKTLENVDKANKYLSADMQIDASSCMYPDNTWFIKDMGHVDYPVGESTDFIMYLLDSHDQLTVFDCEKYPQFMKYSYETNELTKVSENGEKTTADIVFGKLTEIMRKIAEFIGKLL